ncbi:DUF3299 domain-containing protein [Marinospirillum alkaliphilum]|uniref:DUF3299 domain-containing protein n=1 Tax=Marinospirillum alkaliphilum DSM 21637 TaxID=1122209 RepID=A0A1K1UBQ2_9GAMM|nr:DUF3299 domain-containing protein [Marinospirillum alkaliphilum]SFX10271.1 hypothetical protein SAMN02745752_00546 [Marinospirillum alkaliphilum DSM 21637]
MGRVLKLIPWLLLLLTSWVAAAQPLEWDDLLPEGFELDKQQVFEGQDISGLSDFSPEAQRLMDRLQQVLNAAPPVPALDGQRVSLSGFMVPLQREGRQVTHFFLVPWFGSCIHTPPPPANQMVQVVIRQDHPFNRLFGTVKVHGVLKLDYTEHRLGTSAYTLIADKIESTEFIFERRW